MLVFGHLSSWWQRHADSLRIGLNVLVTAGLAYALYRQFFVVNDVAKLYDGFRQNLPPQFWLTLSGVAALMPINLALEVYKLRVVLPQDLRSTWGTTLGQVCGGIAVGLWTPGRVGEFAGRLVDTRPAQRASILLATALGGVAQWSPLLIGGGTALWFWRKAADTSLNAGAAGRGSGLGDYLWGDKVAWVGALALAIGVLTALLFWQSAVIVRWGQGLRLPDWLRGPLGRVGASRLASSAFLKALEQRRVGLLAASWARYVVYLLQMSMAFVAFGLPVELWGAIAGTATLLLLHGFLPVPPALGAFARIEFALLLFAYADPNEVSIAGASLFIFALNLGVPALCGWLFIVRRNVKNDSLSQA